VAYALCHAPLNELNACQQKVMIKLGAAADQGICHAPLNELKACQQKAMIADWQTQWETGPNGFHFLFVELAPGPGAQVARHET
jgi:hypothetical protein